MGAVWAGDLRMKTGDREMGIGDCIGLVISEYQSGRTLVMLLYFSGTNRVLAWHSSCINFV